MIEYIRGVGHFHTTMHMMGNQFVEVDGDRGSVDSYAMLTHHRDGRDGEVLKLDVSGSRYVERVERRDDRWTITRRGGDPTWAPVGVTGLTTDDPTVQWLLDRAEIHDLLMHYALGVDQRDYDRIRRCFAPGFHAAYGDREFDDLDAALRLHRRGRALPLHDALPRHPARRGRGRRRLGHDVLAHHPPAAGERP